MFVASVFSRLSASGLEQLLALFSAVTPSTAVHRFKLSLCPKFLVDTMSDRSRVDHRPRLQARAQPRVFRSTRDPAAPSDGTIAPASESGGPLSQYGKYPLPEYNEIRRLMQTGVSASATNFMTMPLLLKIKFELFNSYAALQSETPRLEMDPEWVNCLQEGNFNNTLDLAFGGGMGKMYRESLAIIVHRNVAIL